MVWVNQLYKLSIGITFDIEHIITCLGLEIQSLEPVAFLSSLVTRLETDIKSNQTDFCLAVLTNTDKSPCEKCFINLSKISIPFFFSRIINVDHKQKPRLVSSLFVCGKGKLDWLKGEPHLFGRQIKYLLLILCRGSLWIFTFRG